MKGFAKRHGLLCSLVVSLAQIPHAARSRATSVHLSCKASTNSQNFAAHSLATVLLRADIASSLDVGARGWRHGIRASGDRGKWSGR